MRLNKKISVGAVCVVVSLAALSVLIPAFYISKENSDLKVKTTETAVTAAPVSPYIVAKDERFDVIVAKTAEERQQGLSGRKSLGLREAMLFIFDTDGSHGFWMKDMLFAIDIVWLDSAYKVVHIQKNTLPESYPNAFLPAADSRYVIEFSAGTAERLGLQEGDLVSIFL